MNIPLSERILNELPFYDEPQDEICLSEEDMLEGFNFGLEMVFSSTDDFWQQIVDFENGLISIPSGEPKYTRAQFKDIVNDAVDIFHQTRAVEGHEETFKFLIQNL